MVCFNICSLFYHCKGYVLELIIDLSCITNYSLTLVVDLQSACVYT